MARTTLVTVCLFVLVALAGPAPAVDDGWGKFLPTKDEPANGNCWADYVNMGANEYAYVKAGVYTWQADFDRQALATILNAYPETIVRLYITTADGSQPAAGKPYVPFTWQSQSVWGPEGDGYWDQVNGPYGNELGWNDYGDAINYNWHRFNWTHGTAPVTMWACQSHYLDPDGSPQSGDEVIDPALATQWTCANGNNTGNACLIEAGMYGGAGSDPTNWCDGKMECVFGAFVYCGGGSQLANSQAIVGLGDMMQAYVKLDQALVNDLIGSGRPNVFALGVAGSDGGDIWNWAASYNVWMCTKENVGNEPFLRLLYPGDATHNGLVDGADYTIWADNYTLNPGGNTWDEGDFNDDKNVDGADYTIWADHYLTGPNPAGGAVPEPCSALLVLLGAPLIRRWKRAA